MSAANVIRRDNGEPSRGSGWRHRLVDYSPPVLIIAAILVAWQVAVVALAIPKAILPAPSQIGQVLVDRWPSFADNLSVTMVEIVSGFLLGLLVGISSAVAIYYSRLFERAIYPLIVISQVIPIFAIAPLLIIWFGFGMTPKIILTALGVFFPITVNMVTGLRSADSGVINLMRSFKASEWQIFRTIRLPSALPLLFAGIQTGITYSVIAAIIAEWVGSEKGIGNMMITANSISRTDIVFAAIFLVGIVGIVLFVGANLVGRFLMPWRRFEQ